MPNPTDIELSVGLSTDDIKKSANDLQKNVKDIFDKSSGKTLGKNLESIQKQMSASAVKANQLMEQLRKLESTKIPTQEFTEVQKQINSDTIALDKLRQKLDEAWTKFNAKPVVQQFNEIDAEVGKLTEKFGSFSKYMGKTGEDLTKALKADFKPQDALKIGPILNEYQQLKTQFDSLYASSPIEKLSSQIEELENSLKYAKSELQDLKETGQDFTLGSDTEQYSKIADNLANVNNQQRLNILRWYEQADAQDRAGASANRLKSIMSLLTTIMRKLGSSIRQTFKDAINIFKRAASYAKNFASAIASIPSHFKKANSSHMDFNKGLKKGITTILKYGFGIRSLYFLFRKLRAAMTDGIKAVVLWEGENGRLNQSISSMLSAVNTLKNSIGAMVTPLINSLAPAITRIIDLINAAIQKIAQFIAALTGQKTFLVAEKVQSNYAKSLDKTAGSANKAKKALDGYLGSFDELNNVNSKNDSDSGSGGAGTGTFKEMPIDPKWLDLVDKLKKMWEDKDFYDLGKQIGEKLRDVLESIPWDKIRQTSNDLGKCLATLINGFIEVERLAFDIGYTVAQGVNTVFEFINGFVHNLHWDSVGEFIAEMFNGFFETIDWALIKDTILTGMQGLADAINSFITNFHWDNISNFISNGLNIIAEGIYTFFKNVHLGELGKNLGEQLMQSIQKIDWKMIGQAIGSVIQSAIDFVSNFVKQLKAEDIVQAITDLINGFFEEVDSEQLGETIANIIDLAIDVAKGFWEKNKDTLKEEGKKLFKGFFDNVDKEDLMNTLGSILKGVITVGIARAIPSILATVAKFGIGKLILGKMFGTAAGAGAAGAGGELLGSATVAGSSIGTAFVGGFLALIIGAEIGKKVGEKIFPEDKDLYEHYSGIKGTFELLKDTVVTLTERTGEHISNSWDNIKEATKVFGERTAEHVTNSWDTIKEAGKTFAERTGEHFDNFKKSGKKSFDDVVTASKTFVERTNEHWTDAKQSLTEFADKVKEKGEDVKDKIDDMKTKCSQHIQTFKDNIAKKGEDIKQHFSDMALNVLTNKNGMVASIGDLKSQSVTKFDNIKQSLQKFKDDWVQKFDTIKTKVEDFKLKLSTTMSNIKDIVIKCFDGIKDGIKAPINAILGFVEKLVNGIIDGFNGLGDKLGSMEFETPDWLPGDLGGKKFELSLPKLNKISLPRLAQGAVIPPNKEFLAMLGDQKSGVNIETPLDTMIEAFNAANRGGNEAELRLLQEQNDLLRQLLQKEFGISERQIYNSVINQDNIRRKSTGYSAFAY